MLRPQPKSGLRKITRNRILDFATFAWDWTPDLSPSCSACFIRFIRFKFLILIGRFVTLEE
jgi:hypothetical protein